jgi:CRISPR-associated protein Csm2
MTSTPKPELKSKLDRDSGQASQTSSTASYASSGDITKDMVDLINKLPGGLSSYEIRDLVNQAKDFGAHLKNNRLDMTQVRKFLDAINRIKADVAEFKAKSNEPSLDKTSTLAASDLDQQCFAAIKTNIVLLRPKLAYAAARQAAAKPLSRVMEAAINQVHTLADFERLVQLAESIVAYHKAAESQGDRK